MSTPTPTLVRWANTETKAAHLQAQGWVCDPNQRITHHHHYAVLLTWPHDYPPPDEVRAA